MGEIIGLKDIIENERAAKRRPIIKENPPKEVVQEKPAEVITIKEPKMPKEFGYLQMLQVLKERGHILKFFYNEGGTLKEAPKIRFEVDSEGQSFIPIRPDVVEVYKYYSEMGFEKIASLNGTRSRDDPDVDTAMNIWDMVQRL